MKYFFDFDSAYLENFCMYFCIWYNIAPLYVYKNTDILYMYILYYIYIFSLVYLQ